MEKITLNNIVGSELEENFLDFDITEIQEVLSTLKNTNAIDLAHAELAQQEALRAADILSEFLGKIYKTFSYLESQISVAKNRASLDFSAPNGKTTSDMKKWAGESSPEVEILAVKLAKAKGSKIVLEKKYDILIKLHHHFKEIATGLRKSVLGYNPGKSDWE